MNKLSIIIPVYYNADTLMDCYADLAEKVLTKLDDYELILVNDGSGDNSLEIMKEISKKDKKVKLLNLSRNFGSHSAILAGLSVGTGECATIKAADLQEPSVLLLDMFESWKKGNRVVMAVRSDRKESVSQKFFANFYYKLVQKIVNKNMPDGGFDCFLIDRKVIEVLKNLDEVNSAVTLQVLWAGFKTDKVYYTRLAREKGKTRWTLAKKIKLVVDSLVGFSFVPIRCMTIAGAVFFLISIAYGIFLLVSWRLNNIISPGWTTLMIVILFSS
jgi:dolichol-phosphate mannosyltransferase